MLGRLITRRDPKSPISEAYRTIRTNIEFSNLDKEIKTIVVTSSQQNEGKSTVIANLAVSFAGMEDKKVLVVEGDLRNPTVHRMFNVSNTHGITEILTGQRSFQECVYRTEVQGLDVITCGKIPPNPSEMLASKKMKAFIESLKDYYDYIFIDAPPIGIITDAGIVSTYTDGTMLVVGSKEVDIDMVKIAKSRLEKVNANILGLVLNKFEESNGSYGYYNYYYEESSSDKRSKKKKKK
ncbi:polysaccharide biosynthesis tyrosine autokinase [Paeniclostridium sordellii]|uniref:CpsD/CapB family tyrosine-protein kinase n=1 Tax=Paraclostridium sordellii TaxID=1505 RepID=UPI0005E679D3|nr:MULTISPECIES: CpsD/CapB family tyrosine-protein kinase [Paeniclostridium]MBW4863514.1 CpsD/CapB family tyrosine-protein kinase [Paeniclostridium sp.]MBW4873164.1 CpsD/CapB family tyrosine-protein kinase [Paeniclostridium sp.]MVO75261.1 polysaccharide biosynthesis tyrosine autokinase [Paeniclostridium sordellii]CEN94108.1 CPSC/CAPB subfamily ATPase [[Clostridium] sordellii] [Paeniclostridium sordellii]CEN96110.1 CPSC/CAPB subfamily ATPase [[Clostridium] sordellii] [Paeniclostridium sordellii